MNIVSIYPHPMDEQYRHDQNVTIISNNKIYSYEEAKLRGSKTDEGNSIPIRSLFFGFKEINLVPQKIDYWIFSKPFRKISLEGYKYFFVDLLKATTKKDLKKFITKNVIEIPHHMGHIYNGFFASPFKSSKILSIDGGGDFGDQRRMLWGEINYKGSDKLNFKKFGETFNNQGLGIAAFHNHLTDVLGFYDNNGKTSGLAAYGKFSKQLYVKLKNFFLLDLKKQKIIFSNKRKKTSTQFEKIKYQTFEPKKYLKISPTNSKLLNICKKYKAEDIAITGEKLLIDITIDFIKSIFATNKDNLICVGGLFNNVVLNKEIIKKTEFKNYYFSMSPGDSGLSLGMALYIKFKHKKKKFSKKYMSKFGLSPYLGPSFKDFEIKEIIQNFNLNYKKFDSYKKVNSFLVKKIVDGKIIGLFRGRGEYGPRSLGSRSILADPRNINSKQKLNLFIKRRDWFMPFAPAIIEEKFSEYFKDEKASLYMQLTQKAGSYFKKIAPAACHVDNSCRTQLVIKEFNPSFHDLILKFGKLTGCYSILNTSFNRHGISTISSPYQAVEHLLGGTIEYLIINNFIISLEENRIMKKNKYSKLINEKKLLENHNILYKKLF